MMTESRRYALDAQLDLDQILREAQHRWLRPAEICVILQNHKKFYISQEPPNRPPNGSLFLFDRKVLRYFRKDGHNWRKKKDGKTVKEAHERLKAGSIDVLHCYYAHGEENENFQRRSYWLLEEALSNIVLVHYREVKGNRTNFNHIRDAGEYRQTEEDLSNSEADSSAGSRNPPYDNRGVSQVTDTASLNSTQASEYEDAESAYRQQASAGFQLIHELQSSAVQSMEVGSRPYFALPISGHYQGQFSAISGVGSGSTSHGEKNKNSMDNGHTYEVHQDLDISSWENVVERNTTGYQPVTFQQSSQSSKYSAMGLMLGQENELLYQVLTGASGIKQDIESRPDGLADWQAYDRDSAHISKWSVDQKSDANLDLDDATYCSSLKQPVLYDFATKLNDDDKVQLRDSPGLGHVFVADQSGHPMQNELQLPISNPVECSIKSKSIENLNADGKINYPAFRQPLLDGLVKEGLKKLDSFDRWMSKELGDVATESHMQPGSGAYWETVESEDGVDSGIPTQMPLENFLLGPSLSQEQLFSIIDFSPSWAYSGSKIKVLVMGRFLRSQQEVEKYKWACMFGEVEVTAEIIADGVLRCHTPLHEARRVPFYITCSNRLACSEVREFEFRTSSIQDVDGDIGTFSSDETILHMRFGKLLSLGSGTPQTSVQSGAAETSHLHGEIGALLKDDTEWEQMLNLTKQDEFSADRAKDQLLQKLLKEKLHFWLLQKIDEGGKGPSVLDESGLGVLHYAGALGYDWVIPPTIAAGVSVNFRDANGWTALHWAAYYGRERTVGFLISVGATPGLLTDPTPKYPSGIPPAELASSNGQKGIAGYLAELSLSSHLSSLKLKGTKEIGSRENSVETVSEQIATLVGDGDLSHGLSLKHSLAAVRNATQAAAQIHQVFRVQSFQRKQLIEYGDRELGISDERAISLLALKTKKAGQRDEPVHAAAIRIQNKFRSWKGRKDFLLIRQRIIRIQAHVRGHQVRKNYRKIIWSVGILDKVILRWRRKGRGLSGFKPEPLAASTSMPDTEIKEDDYDFLKEGRKQTEERLHKALARVKSMVQYPEARDQYSRLLNAVSEMQERKAASDKVMNDPEVDFDDDLIDIEALLDDGDDTFMSTAS